MCVCVCDARVFLGNLPDSESESLTQEGRDNNVWIDAQGEGGRRDGKQRYLHEWSSNSGSS